MPEWSMGHKNMLEIQKWPTFRFVPSLAGHERVNIMKMCKKSGSRGWVVRIFVRYSDLYQVDPPACLFEIVPKIDPVLDLYPAFKGLIWKWGGSRGWVVRNFVRYSHPCQNDLWTAQTCLKSKIDPFLDLYPAYPDIKGLILWKCEIKVGRGAG